MDWEMTLRNEREKGREEGREEGRMEERVAVGKGRSLISVKAMDECRDKCNSS